MNQDALRWEHFAQKTPGLALSLVILAPPWVPPASAGLVRGAHAPSHLLRRLQLSPRAEVGKSVQRTGCLHQSLHSGVLNYPCECPVVSPKGTREPWPPAGNAFILLSLQEPGTGPKRGAASVQFIIYGALRGTGRPARRWGYKP